METRQLGRDLRAALEGLDNAQLATANIESKVALVQAQMLGIGLNGIAKGLAAIRQSLTAVQGEQASVADKARTCAGPVSIIGEDSTPKDVITQLSSVVTTAEAAVAATAGVIDEFAAISKKIAAALDGGRPEKLLALVGDVVETLLDPARKKLQAVRAGAQAAVAEARRAGELGLGGSSSLDLSPPAQLEPIIGDQVPDPDDQTGARIRSGSEESAKKSRGRRFRATGVREVPDVSDSISDGANLVKDGFSVGGHPPTGHPVVGVGGSVHSPAQSTPSAPDIAIGLTAAGAMIGEVIRWSLNRSRELKTKEHTDASEQ